MKALSIGSFDSFWKAALVAGGIVAWSLPVWNVVVNPYQIFNPTFSIGDRFSSSTTNERFLKVEYLLNEAKQTSPNSPEAIIGQINDESPRDGDSRKTLNTTHDAFIVGSSIMGLSIPIWSIGITLVGIFTTWHSWRPSPMKYWLRYRV